MKSDLAAIALLIYCVSCTPKKEISVVTLDIPKNTIPEGIAVSERGIFVSSVHLDKIFQTDHAGVLVNDALLPDSIGYSIGVGMDIQQGVLRALGSKNRSSTSFLLELSLKTNEVTRTSQLDDSTATYFNDLALLKNGDAYMTDSEHHRIYHFNDDAGDIEIFLEDEQIQYPNGICVSDDQQTLYIDSYFSGVRIVDIGTKRILNTKHAASSERGIDGLKYFNGSLYAIINGGSDRSKHGLVRMKLVSSDSIGPVVPVLMAHELMDLPTTFAIWENNIYMIANSQMEKLNQETNQIINAKDLTATYIIKVPIGD